jgi:regulator of protease activity HflC (stomatin/prohibitin superfamily)
MASANPRPVPATQVQPRKARFVIPCAAAVAIMLGWLSSGIRVVPLGERAIYARLGTTVGILQAGLHAGWPYPIGRYRAVEAGRVHGVDVADSLHLLFRVGLTDQDAIRSTTAVAAPNDVVRTLAQHILITTGAALPDLLTPEARQQSAASFRTTLQHALDAAGAGLEILSVVFPNAPTSNAADTLRAAEITAGTSVAVAHGDAVALYAQARQRAYDMIAQANAAAAGIVDDARVSLIRFTADRDASHAGGASFLLERYFADLSAALAKTPKTIIDHRLNWPEAPVLDLRPFSPTAAAAPGHEE